jgi:undecaprenyl-phosphate 4-deoxy-4-formamido-L-arabinose transferase
MGAEIARQASAFRVFRTELRAAFADYRSPFVSIDVLLTWATTRFGAVVVRHEPRAAGQSNYTLGKLVTHAFNMLTGFSTFPLQLASLIGFGCTLLGIALLLYVLARALFEGGAPAGFPFLASMVALFSGAQLFALGILGEYLARMHSRTMDRPAYTVQAETTPRPAPAHARGTQR